MLAQHSLKDDNEHMDMAKDGQGDPNMLPRPLHLLLQDCNYQ